MAEMKRNPNHQCCPKEWRATPVVTGSYELDESIKRSKNPALLGRLAGHVAGGGPGYGPLTGYDGYAGYAGDN